MDPTHAEICVPWRGRQRISGLVCKIVANRCQSEQEVVRNLPVSFDTFSRQHNIFLKRLRVAPASRYEVFPNK